MAINVINGAATTSTDTARQIVFIDAAVPDVQTLLAGLAPDAVAVVLDSGQDGLQQIADYLAANELSDLSAIQIVSHGSEGSITLGSTVVNSDNLASYADLLAQIGATLAPDGDIMLYGCDVAAGTIGQQFIEALAKLTSADVTASTDPTGAAALGGNWVLEASTGSIEAAPEFTAAAQSDFNALLLTTVLTPTAPEFQVETNGQNGPQEFVSSPAMAALAGGGYVVVWMTTENADGNGVGLSGAIFGQLFNNNNQKVGSQFQVNSSGLVNDQTPGGTSNFNQVLPTVAALTDGGFVVAWQTFVDGNTRDNIDAQRFKVDANGAIFVDVAGNTVVPGTHTEFRVSTLEPADSVAVSVTGRLDGGFVFTWTDSIDLALDNAGANGLGYEILARTYSAAGVAGTAQIVNAVTTDQQISPDVASQQDGSSVVIFQALNHTGDGSSWGMYARKIDVNGVPQGGADIQINTTTLGMQAGGSIAALSDINNDGVVNDGYIVVWTSADQNNTHEHIFGRRLDTNGNPVGNEFQIDINGGTAPSVVALSDGSFVVNWNNGGVVGRRFDAVGSQTPTATTGEVAFSSLSGSSRGDSAPGVDVSPAYAGRDAMAFLTDGSLVAVWGQRTFPSIDANIMVRDFAVGIDSPNSTPVLDPDKTPILGSVPEGFANHFGTPHGPMGTLISELVDLNPPPGGLDNVTDANANAVTGIAITNLDTTHGDWWYTTDGTNWKLIGAVSATAAFALAADANTRIFFVADLGFDGTISNAITFHAWDQSIGFNGADLNTTIGFSAFSTAADSADVTVDPFNEAPLFTGAGSTRSFAEHGGPIALETTFTISDHDDTDVAGATVSIQNFVAGDLLTINGQTSGTDVVGNIDFSFVDGVLTLFGDDSFENYQEALSLVQFQHVGDNPTAFGTSPTRTINWQVSDGHGLSDPLFTHFFPTSDLTGADGGRTPRAVALGDFNGDGNLDFVAAVSDSSFDFSPVSNRFNLVVELGNGDGTFGQKEFYKIAPVDPGIRVNPRDVGIELGLFNDDALLDIAVTSSTLDQVMVFLGAADGKFTPQAVAGTNAPLPPGYATGFGPLAIASGLFDNDDQIDLVTANGTSISFLHGNGDGTFAPDPFSDPDLTFAGVGIRGIAAADINHDGHLDIIASDDIFGISVYFGDGAGDFASRVVYFGGNSPGALAVADLNKDGLLDIVVTNFETGIVGDGTVSVLLQKPDGTFDNPASYTSGGRLPKAVQIADLNSDGILDLAIANSGSTADPNDPGFDPNTIDPGNISVLLGVGDGTFGAPLSFVTGSGPRSLAIGDINKDGQLDIATPDFFDFTVSVLINNNQASAILHTTINVTASNDAPEVTAPALLATTPNSPLSLKGVVFADVDGGAAGQTETATFTASAGTGVFTASSGGGVVAAGDGTETLILTGSIADLNAFIDTNQLNFNATDDTSVHVVINDQGNTGGTPVPGLEAFADITIDVNAPPVFGNVGPGVTYTELTAPVQIDSDLTLDDPDGNTIHHASVRITAGGLTTDRLMINGATSSGGVPIDGTNINWSYSLFTRTLTLSGSDTEEHYQQVLDLVTFNNTSNNPTNSGFNPTRTITWLANDGAADSTTTTTVTIDPINSPPGFFLPPRTPLTYVEGGLAVIGLDEEFDPLQITDIDGPTPIKGGTITISDGHIAGDRITWFNQASGFVFNDDDDLTIQFGFNPQTGVFTFTTLDPSANYSQFFNQLRFSFRADDNLASPAFGDDPSAGGTDPTRTLTWQIDDGGASNNLSTPVDQTININASNDAPVITIPTGTLDLVTANLNSGNASVLLGGGTGAFAFLPPPNPVGTSPTAVALGDLNGDTMLDMVTANEGTANVSVLLGNGRGGFAPAPLGPFAVDGPAKAVALGDLNGDNKLDIVTANSNGNVSVLLGDGLGNFAPHPTTPSPFPVGASPNSVALADFNSDGKLDIVVTDLGSDAVDPNDDGVSVLLGDGLGGFAAAVPSVIGPSPFSVEAGVVFGSTSIVVANANSSNIFVEFNTGGGTFSGFPISAADVVNDIVLGDVNGDGTLDLVASIGAGPTAAIEVRLGIFSPLQPIPLPDTAGQVRLADVNGDGRLDIVAVHPDSDTFSVLLNDGGNNFTLMPPQSIGAGDMPVAFALGNLDNAQVTDEGTVLVFSAANGNAITLSDADGGSGNETLTLTVGSGTLTLATTDDLLVNGEGSDTVTLTGPIAAINAALNGLSYAPDADYTGPDTLTITADDNGHTGTGGNLTATKLVPIFVNENLPPSAPADDDGDANVVTEGAPAGTEVQIDVSSTDPEATPVTFSFAPAGDAGGRFAIDPTSGVVTVANAALINFESSGGSYDITVRATDGTGKFSDAVFTINVNDVAPTTPVDGVPPPGGSVQEGAGNGTTVGIDADSTDVNGGTVTFAITAGNTGNAFAIDTNGVITVNDAAQINFETLTSYSLTVQASTVDGTLVSTQNFTVDVTNAAPVFNTDTNGNPNTVSEGAANGDTVGITANFSDPNGGTVTYSLFDNAGGRFAINSTTGVVTVANAALLNFESNTSHNITVRGSDPSGAFNDQGFSIAVTNVAPVAIGDGYSVAEDQTLNVLAASGVLANDNDVHGGNITAVLNTGPANALSFALQSDGSFTYQPNANFNGADSFTYHPFDGTAAGTTVTVNLNVTAVNDPPVLNPAATPVLNNVNEDAGAPVGAVGTLVSSLVDLVGGGGLDNVTDVDNTTTGIGLSGVTSANGTWLFSTNGGTNWSPVPLNLSDGTAMLRLAADANTRLYFQPNANFNGTITNAISFRAWDQSSGGNGTLALDNTAGMSSAADTANITVTAVNDPPVNVLPGQFSVDKNASLVLAGLALSDPDAASGTMTTTLSVAHGTLTAASAGGAGVSGNGTASVTLTGTLAQINTTLSAPNNVVYHSSAGNFQDDTLTMVSNDGGNTGLGGSLSDTDSSNIHLLTTSTFGFDFNADGRGDILWQNANGTPAVWLMNGTDVSAFGPALPNPGASWHEVDAGDFNGDGKADILWQNANGTPAVWLMDGVNLLSAGPALPNPGPTWHAAEAGDFNGDGKADILWQNSDGTPAVWLMDGVNVLSFGPALTNPGASWQVKDAADFNGDGKADILWQNANGTPAVWLMNGTDALQFGPGLPNPGASWHEIAGGDFNGDGKADILWQNSDGTPAVWLMDGVNVLSVGPALTNPGASWHAVEAEDFNRDGKADILWQNSNGQAAVWLMDGGTPIVATGVGANPGADWHVI